jgi:hypothetical protein
VFYNIGLAITLIFIVEIAIRSYCYRFVKKEIVSFLKNPYNIVDIVVISIDIVFLCLPSPAPEADAASTTSTATTTTTTGKKDDNSGSKFAKTLRLVRMIRLLRIFRGARVLAKLNSLGKVKTDSKTDRERESLLLLFLYNYHTLPYII